MSFESSSVLGLRLTREDVSAQLQAACGSLAPEGILALRKNVQYLVPISKTSALSSLQPESENNSVSPKTLVSLFFSS